VAAILQNLPPEQRAMAISSTLRDPALIEFSQKQLAKGALEILHKLSPRGRAKIFDALLADPVVVDTPHGSMRFLNHGRKSCWRAETILTKEPDSLKWIDGMGSGSVFWDIGANVGVLTLYAASRGDLEVWAFEPAAVNYYILTANCELNAFSKEVRCLLLGFGQTTELAELRVSQLDAAGAFSFKQKKGREEISDRQMVQVWAIDDLIERYDMRCPNYIKIDVHGLTQEILTGATRTLLRPDVRQIQIEAKEHGAAGKRISEFLAAFGFRIVNRNMKRGGTMQGDLVFGRG